MRRTIALVLVLAACGGDAAPATTTGGITALDRAAAQYAASATRAIEGTAFEVLDAGDLADIVVGLCEGLGVGAIGVAAADTGIEAGEADVAIFLEVLRTGLDQVCEERVVVDLTSIYLDTISTAAAGAGAASAFDEIAAIRAAPVVCEELDRGLGGAAAVLAVADVLYGIRAGSLDDLAASLDPAQGTVVGAVLATATALLCPRHLESVEALLGSL